MSSSSNRQTGNFRIAVDIGGTFTDGVVFDTNDGSIRLAKSLTTHNDPGEAVSTVVQSLLKQIDTAGGQDVSEVVHATTLVTNAIIERRGGKTALVVTKGFADTLDIRREDRYDLFDLDLAYPEPLVKPRARIEVAERLAADGSVCLPLDKAEVDAVVERLKHMKVAGVAICLLHAYANDAHERLLADAIRKALPEIAVSLSSEAAREIREFERMSTVTANAFVQPIASDYLARLQRRLAAEQIDSALRIMISSGGFTSTDFASRLPVKLLESGPAAGVLSAVNTASRASVSHLLAFDMGGTTAKACVAVHGKPEITNLFEAGRMKRFAKGSGLPIIVPSIDLIEIGAGGGSIAHVNDMGLLQVGPESAGSEPGPACYGLGGSSPTVTDADLLLGYLDPDFFLGGKMDLSIDAAETTMNALAGKLDMEPNEVAFGINNLVNENMASAARVHVAEKGMDPRTFTMVATGGAGPVHAVEVAQKLGLSRVICSVAAGNGSCLGLFVAPARVDRAWSRVELVNDIDWSDAQARLDEMYRDAVTELGDSGVAANDVQWNLTVEMRFQGQGDTISVPFVFGALAENVMPHTSAAFKRVYKRLYGDLLPDSPLEIVTWRLVGEADSQPMRFLTQQKPSVQAEPIKSRKVYLPDLRDFVETPVYDRGTLAAGTRLNAPLIIQETESTIVVARSAVVSVLEDLSVSVELGPGNGGRSMTSQFDPISLEILRARFVSIVDEASATFKRASFSTLVREANDFAIVLADSHGRGIAQYSKGIPSFLGTIPNSIKRFMSIYPPETLADGDVLITNDPWDGTGHIHDVTIVMPIFFQGRIAGYAGLSTHLPDIGGQIRSASCREIFEEGLQIPKVKLFEGGKRNETLFSVIGLNVRTPEHTIGDILAAVAGCQAVGSKLCHILETEHLDLEAFADALLERSERVMREAIAAIPDGGYAHTVQHDGFEERITIACTIRIRGSDMDIDYAGTSSQLPRAVNVVPVYTFAYTVYGIKAILAPNLPNNEGTFYPITVHAPEGTILNPRYPAAGGARGMIGHMLPTAVMGALAPVLGDRVGAEGSANSSFTMSGEHNGRRYAVVNFVNAGQGATASRPGHTVLSFPSNLGNTPVESMESLAPIRVLSRKVRKRSGGRGINSGGDGLSLSFEFLGDSPAVCSFLTTRRIVAPKGVNGGKNGKPARVRVNGREIDTTHHQILKCGDIVIYETAGGGGWGKD